jgi:hypothetical protein
MLPIYLLIAGPGRSGSTYIYNALSQHSDVATAGWKEAYLYRNEKKLICALMSRADKKVFLDVANRAFLDKRLKRFLKNYQLTDSYRMAVIYLWRDQGERMASVLDFRKSRGMIEAYIPEKLVERRLRDEIFHKGYLEGLCSSKYATAVLKTEALPRDPTELVGQLEDLLGLGLDRNQRLELTSFNNRAAARNILLSSIGKLFAYAMRGIGFTRLVERLKTNSRVKAIFFAEKGTFSSKNDFSPIFKAATDDADRNVGEYLRENGCLKACGWLVGDSNLSEKARVNSDWFETDHENRISEDSKNR